MLVPILLPVTQICLTGSLYTILAVAIERFLAVTRYMWFSIESYFLLMLIFLFQFLEHGGNICLPPFAQFAEQTFELLDSKENFNLCRNLSIIRIHSSSNTNLIKTDNLWWTPSWRLVKLDWRSTVLIQEDPSSCKWSSGGSGLLQMIIITRTPILRTFLEQFVLVSISWG